MNNRGPVSSSTILPIINGKEGTVTMQTFLLRRTKGLANDQMRMMCAVIATALLIISLNNHQNNPQTNTKENVVGYERTTIKHLVQDVEQFISETIFNDRGITEEPCEVGDDFLLEAGIENEINSKTLRERQMFISTSEKNLRTERNRVRKEIAVKEQLDSITCDPTDITKISNLTEEQIGMMVEGTWLEGKEETLYQIEREQNVNVFFMYAVGTLESEFGTSPRARNRDNYYGIELLTDFESYEYNTWYFADMMNRMYIDNQGIGSNIYEIGPVYCPPNPAWADTVSRIMNQQYKKICELTVA